MIGEHSRFEIWNAIQHPFKHTLADFSYTNGALPGVSNIESALNYFTSVIYPKYVGNSATDFPFAGILDEVRISTIVRSGDCISAEHDSMSGSLIGYGTDEAQ